MLNNATIQKLRVKAYLHSCSTCPLDLFRTHKIAGDTREKVEFDKGRQGKGLGAKRSVTLEHFAGLGFVSRSNLYSYRLSFRCCLSNFIPVTI